MDETVRDHGQEEPSEDREVQNHGSRDMDPQDSPRLHQILVPQGFGQDQAIKLTPRCVTRSQSDRQKSVPLQLVQAPEGVAPQRRTHRPNGRFDRLHGHLMLGVGNRLA